VDINLVVWHLTKYSITALPRKLLNEELKIVVIKQKCFDKMATIQNDLI
jgi:hypothetical protein